MDEMDKFDEPRPKLTTLPPPIPATELVRPKISELVGELQATGIKVRRGTGKPSDGPIMPRGIVSAPTKKAPVKGEMDSSNQATNQAANPTKIDQADDILDNQWKQGVGRGQSRIADLDTRTRRQLERDLIMGDLTYVEIAEKYRFSYQTVIKYSQRVKKAQKLHFQQSKWLVRHKVKEQIDWVNGEVRKGADKALEDKKFDTHMVYLDKMVKLVDGQMRMAHGMGLDGEPMVKQAMGSGAVGAMGAIGPNGLPLLGPNLGPLGLGAGLKASVGPDGQMQMSLLALPRGGAGIAGGGDLAGQDEKLRLEGGKVIDVATKGLESSGLGYLGKDDEGEGEGDRDDGLDDGLDGIDQIIGKAHDGDGEGWGIGEIVDQAPDLDNDGVDDADEGEYDNWRDQMEPRELTPEEIRKRERDKVYGDPST